LSNLPRAILFYRYFSVIIYLRHYYNGIDFVHLFFVFILTIGCVLVSWNLVATDETSIPIDQLAKEQQVEVVDSTDIYGKFRFITEDLIEGSNLIYRCDQKRFICVDDAGMSWCEEERLENLGPKRVVSPCLPLKRLKTLKECVEEQYTRIHTFFYDTVCSNKKEIRVRRD